MTRLVVILSFAGLSLLASCVDLSLPAQVSSGTGTLGGRDGSVGGSGGKSSTSADAGSSDALPGGQSGGRTGGTGGTGGSSGGSSGGSLAGGTGGSSNTGGTTFDAGIDKPFADPDVPLDTGFKSDDAEKTGPEAGRPEAGLDAPADSTPDRPPDSPDTVSDALTCIQKIKNNNYSLLVSSDAGVKSCRECKTVAGDSLEASCKSMVDCLISAWVCMPGTGGECWLKCRNSLGVDMVVDGCVTNLLTNGCP